MLNLLFLILALCPLIASANPFLDRRSMEDLSASAQCLKKNPQDKDCQKRYTQLKKIYEQKQCLGKNQHFELKRAHRKYEAGFSRTKDPEGNPVFLEKVPLFSMNDVEQFYFNMCSAPRDRFIAAFLQATPAGKAALARETKTYRGEIAIVVRDSVKLIMRLSAPVTEGRLEICVGDESINPDQLKSWFCEKYESEKLPPDLQVSF